jgi:hypothetical protein
LGNDGVDDDADDKKQEAEVKSHRGFMKAENLLYRDADKSLARPGRKQVTATEDFEFHISYL